MQNISEDTAHFIKLRAAIAKAVEAVPGEAALEPLLTHAIRRRDVYVRLVNRVNALVFTISMLYPQLSPEAAATIHPRVNEIANAVEELSECLRDADADSVALSQSYRDFLTALGEGMKT